MATVVGAPIARSEPQRGGIVLARVDTAPTELVSVVRLAGCYKDIAPTELCAMGPGQQ